MSVLVPRLLVLVPRRLSWFPDFCPGCRLLSWLQASGPGSQMSALVPRFLSWLQASGPGFQTSQFFVWLPKRWNKAPGFHRTHFVYSSEYPITYKFLHYYNFAKINPIKHAQTKILKKLHFAFQEGEYILIISTHSVFHVY